MENGVAYKNNLSGVLILEITSACRDKKKKPRVGLFVSTRNEGWIDFFIRVSFFETK
jgi:hypothetical protein